MPREKQSKESPTPFDAGKYFNEIHGDHSDVMNPSPQDPRAKIPPLDRLNGLVRSENYHADYQQYVVERGNTSDVYVGSGCIDKEGSRIELNSTEYTLSLSKPAKVLCRKWNLLYPIDPDHRPVEESLHCLSRPIEYVPDPSEWHSMQAYRFVGSSDKAITHINGKLSLLVDMSYSKTKLRNEFEKFLTRWDSEHKKGRNKGKIDKWDIYDEYLRSQNFLEITRDLHGVENHTDNHPFYNKEVNSMYQQVKRAYQSACEIIKILEQNTAN